METSIIPDDFNIKVKHADTLFKFIKSNRDDQFLEYLSNLSVDEVDVNIKDDNGNYLIFFAVINNKKKIVTKLIEYGARLDILDTEGYSILYYPIKFNYTELTEILLETNKNILGISLINIKDNRGVVPIFYAIRFLNKYALQELLIYGADANYKNDENVTCLHLAVFKKDIVMIRMLLGYIKNINVRTSKGSTALHIACNFQLTAIIKVLLEAGADPNLTEYEYDFTPLFYSIIQNNFEITKILIEHGAGPNYQDYIGNTIIHYAIINNHLAILDLIMNYYPIQKQYIMVYTEDINNKYLNTNNFIDPNIINIDGLTMAHIMLYNYKPDYDLYLIKIIPQLILNYQDNSGNTILHIIAEKNIWKKFEQYLNYKKMNIYIKNNDGKTVIDMVPFEDREKFITIVSHSYYNYLKQHHNGWLLDWQNKCSATNLSEIDENNCIKLIEKTIKEDKISVPVKKNKKVINVEQGEIVHFSTFTGSLLDLISGFKYLILKHKNAATLFHSKQSREDDFETYAKALGIEENPRQHLIYFELRWIYQKLFFPPTFESIITNIIKNKKYKYIIIPIGIILSNGSHSNALFFDIEKNVLERFEPHGSGYPTQFNYNPELLDEIIYKKMKNLLSNIYGTVTTLKYYRPYDYLPKIGFQIFENQEININKNIGDPNGFCSLWCIWYLDHRLEYPNQSPHRIVKKLISQIRINNLSFRTIIRNYSIKITDLRDLYLKKIGKNINDYLNNRLTKKDLNNLLEEILTDDS